MNAWKQIRKCTTVLAALGWLWLSVGGAFHFHEAASASHANEHCAVCHTLPQFKTAKIASAFPLMMPVLRTALLDVTCSRPDSVASPLPARSRSPPSA